VLFPIGVGREVIPLGGEYHRDDDGFRSSIVAAGQLSLANIEPLTSVALLGEPGIGRSHAVRDVAARDNTVVDVGLDSVADVQEVRDRLAAVDAAVDEGVPPHRITVRLDSIDECALPTKVLLHHLEATLRRHPTPRIVLGCRTADWPETFGARLRALVPGFEVYELLPLGRDDIAELAASRGVDGTSFLAAIVDAAAVPLAALPLTLDLLLGTYEQSGRLPGSAARPLRAGAASARRGTRTGPRPRSPPAPRRSGSPSPPSSLPTRCSATAARSPVRCRPPTTTCSPAPSPAAPNLSTAASSASPQNSSTPPLPPLCSTAVAPAGSASFTPASRPT
jgi:hypothetical protein